jgi:transcriptional antiterminator RfaH
MSATSRHDWFVVQTHPHAEVRAAAHLGRQGFEAYLPRYLKRRRHARRVDIVAAPLFPRYLFVAVDLAAHRWRALQSTIGVAHLVKCGDAPAAVPTGVVEELRGREDEQGYVRLQEQSRFSPGDRIRVLDGAFSEALGLFECVKDEERVAILLDLLGRKVRVMLTSSMIEAA